MRISTIIYQLFLATYKIAPFKRIICSVLKYLKISNDIFYKDLKFDGNFKVEISDKKKFFMHHYGGTIENETFWKGLFKTFESDTGWLWIQLCSFSNTIFDIGANTGLYSLVAKTINPKAKVYAFEPSFHTFHKLVYNNKLNHYDIKCEEIAISNNDMEQVFYDTTDSNQTSASLSPDKLNNWEDNDGEIVKYQVKSLTLSSYISNNKIESIDLIKIDVEMHEPEVIEGLGEYLLMFRPVVVIEVLSEEVASRLNNLIDINKYVIFHLYDTQIGIQVDKFSVYPGRWNFIFFHKEIEEKVKSNTTLYN